MNPQRRRLLCGLGAGSALLLSPALCRAKESRRIITYYGDQQVSVPRHITRIASPWPAQNAIIAMLGYGDAIVATAGFVKEIPAFRHFVPSISDAVAIAPNKESLNMEELIRIAPDILFLPLPVDDLRRKQLRQAGIAVAAFKANAMTALVERTLITGEILGDQAYQRAQDYQHYFEDNVRRVGQALEGLAAGERLRVYHSVGEPLLTSGRPSLNQDWMDLAGAVNVAEKWFSGGNRTGKVTFEQIMMADPDLIVAMRAGDAAFMRGDSRWKTLRAVRKNRVYANPHGMFWWCRETSEQALQFLWLAGVLYPERLADMDMRAETRNFY